MTTQPSNISLPDLSQWGDTDLGLLLIGGAALVVLLSVAGLWRRTRESRAARRRQSEIRRHYGQMQMQQAELERLASRIIATSSTGQITGFELVRQIEAVFTDGHASPSKAAEALKALAAEKGANAIINLAGQRLASGKCAAHGDAVMVKSTDAPPTSGRGAPPPTDAAPS
ncbi:MAG: hypothetical protein AB7Q17_06735 [Phycisphaerae bacterium]